MQVKIIFALFLIAGIDLTAASQSLWMRANNWHGVKVPGPQDPLKSLKVGPS